MVNNPLIISLVQNAGMLLAMVVAFDFLTSRARVRTQWRPLLAGFVSGLVGMLMMAISAQIGGGLIFDARSVLLAVTGLFFGFWPTAIAVVMTGMFRLLIGGPAAPAGMAVILACGAIGVLWRRLRRKPLEDLGWRDLYLLGLTVHSVMLLIILILLPREADAALLATVVAPILLVLPLATVAVGQLLKQRLKQYSVTSALAKSEARFRLLAENARDIIFRFELAPRRRFTYVSPSVRSLTGYTPEEHYADPEFGWRMVHPDDRHLFEQAQRGESSPDQPLVIRRVRKDGEVYWSEERFTVFRDEAGAVTAVEGIARDITHSRQTEERLRLALEAANQGLYDIDLQTGVSSVSDEFALMLGYEPEGFDVSIEASVARTHPEDRERLLTAVEDYIAGKRDSFQIEFRQRRSDGEWMWILSRGSIVAWDAEGKPRRMLGTHTDITALKRAEESMKLAQAETARLLADAERSRQALMQLVEEQRVTERRLLATQNELQRLTQILEATQAAARVGGWELDVVSDTLSWTSETYRIHDTSPSEYTPSLASALSFFTPESVPVFQTVLEMAIQRGITRDVELELITFAGRRKSVHFTTSVTAVNGRTSRVTCAIQDITTRKQAERDRLALTAQLHQSQKLESLGSLAGGVAHDINNVLAAILSLASAHRKRLDEADPIARALDTITTACVRGRSVVRSLLYFARSDVGTRGPVDLNGIARDVVQLLESTTLKRYRLVTDLAHHLPSVDGDEGAISHAVMNLCLNAVDAMAEGGEVRIRTRSHPDGAVEITVSDDGPGMAPEVREKAIEPFFTTKPLGKGSGLGLATVYGTMNAHKGKLDIRSVPGEGTDVTLFFPPAEDAGRSEALASPPRQTAPPAGVDHPVVDHRPLRILLVDDDELIREGVASLLEMEGHAVRLAASGADALDFFRGGAEVDLVILDVNMPGLSGTETLPRILAIRPDQAVLMCSGHGDDEMLKLAATHAGVLTLRKPFTLDELEEKLDAVGLGNR